VKRIRQFYEDHETACNIAIGVASFAVFFGIARRVGKSVKDSRPTAVDLWQLDGGGASMIVVHTKDGLDHHFIREIAQEVAAA
jgi:hypothetical protein